MPLSLATVITYCTNDYRYIGRCIAEAERFSNQIVVPVCDHFFDGTPENRFLLDQTYANHPDCEFIEFAYLPDRLYSPYHSLSPADPEWANYWTTTTRYVGFHYLNPDIEWILFLDSDEIVEGGPFLEWLRSGEGLLYDAQRLAAYLYAIRPTLRSTKAVNLPLLVRKNTLAPLTLLNGIDRIGAYQAHPGPKRERVLGLDCKPLFHHYSWVRTKEECLHKARTWSHHLDHDWPTRIEQAFAGKPSRLFEYLVEFEEIPVPYFDPFAIDLPANVRRIDDRDLFIKGLEVL